MRQHEPGLTLGSLRMTLHAIGNANATATHWLHASEAKSKIAILLMDGEHSAGTIQPNVTAELAASF